MKPTLELDLTRPNATADFGRFGTFGDMTAPEGETDPKRGLQFPLTKGGFMLASGGVIDDASGTIEIVFTPAAASPGGTLVQAWGQYSALLSLTGEGVSANVYGAGVGMLVRLDADEECRVRFSWHHECGFTLTVQPQGRPAQVLRQRHAWTAYRQKYAPFSVGGMVDKDTRRLARWIPSFNGWIKSVCVWPVPLDVPGTPGRAASGAPIAAPFAPVDSVHVVAIDDPPITPDPLGLVSLPHRSLEDLRKTREVGELDRVVQCCKDELEVFSMLTWYIGNLWPHGNYWPWPADETRWLFWKRGHELLPLIKAGEAGGMCGGYAHVMEEVFWAFGFDARRVNVSHHSSFEAYSNALDRWVVCDASQNAQAHLLADTQGRFLGITDIVRRFETAAFDAKALLDVRHMVCNQENMVPTAGGSWNTLYGSRFVHAYDRFGICIDKTHQLGRDSATARPSRMAWYVRECEREWFRTQPVPEGEEAPVLVDHLDDLTPSRNRVSVKLEWATPGETLQVAAAPVGVTFLDTLLVAIDDAAEMLATAPFTWPLHAGVNRLTIRTRNQLGALGYPYTIRLWKRP